MDAELKVSQLEETITVTGATPLVDVQRATQQRTVTREVLDAVPTAKSVLGIAALIPAVVEPPNAQDVGGSKGERSVRISVHGGKTFDSRLLQDGMRYNALTPGVGQPNATTPSTPTSPAPVFTASLEGTGRGYYINPLAVDEVVVDLGTMGSAEYSLGGAQVNSIPKSGSNSFSGSLFLAGTSGGLQSNNLDDDLISQGLTSVNSVKKVYDVNGAVGGPLMRNRLWFFASGRFWGTTTHVANLYADANTTDFLYTPDLSRPIEPVENDKGGGGRLTFQASSKDKFTFSFDKQRNFQDQLTGQLETGTIKNEANQGYCQTPPGRAGHVEPAAVDEPALRRRRDGEQVQLPGLRRRPVPQRLPGVRRSARRQRVDQRRGTGVHLQRRRRRPGHELVAPVERTLQRVVRQQPAHASRPGVFWMYGLGGGQRAYNVRAPAQVNGLPVTYTFLNGDRPASPSSCRRTCRSTSSAPTSRCSCRISGG